MENQKLFCGPLDDAARAKMFDELLSAEDTPEEARNAWRFRVAVIMITLDLNEAEAKALLVSLITFESMDPVEKSFCVDRGEAVRRAMEWKSLPAKKSYILPSRGAVQ